MKCNNNKNSITTTIMIMMLQRRLRTVVVIAIVVVMPMMIFSPNNDHHGHKNSSVACSVFVNGFTTTSTTTTTAPARMTSSCATHIRRRDTTTPISKYHHQRYHSMSLTTIGIMSTISMSTTATTFASTRKSSLTVMIPRNTGTSFVRYMSSSSSSTGIVNEENHNDISGTQQQPYGQNSFPSNTTTNITIDIPSSSFSVSRLYSYIPSQYQSIFRVMISILSLMYRTINHSILLQLCILMGLYLFHLTILSQHVAILCWNTIAMGYDSLVGATIGIFYMLFRIIQFNSTTTTKQQQQQQQQFPWNLPRPQLPNPQIQQQQQQHTAQDYNRKIDDDVNNSVLNSNTNPIVARSSLSQNDTKSVRMMIRHHLKDWMSSRQSTSHLSNHTDNYTWIRFRISMILTCGALIKAYYQTGRYSLFWEDLLYSMSAAGWPLTVPLSRSIQVLAGHLTWVAAGCTILWAIPRPPPFFQSLRPQQPAKAVVIPNVTTNKNINGNMVSPESTKTTTSTTSTTTPYRWFQMSLRDCNWLWWTIGGYYVSSWLFNVADVMNRNILPLQVLQEATESVVTQLVQPEQNDILASMIGYIAPCISAPVWEELLYRGFLLAGLTAWTGSYHISCIVQAIIFSAHHMSITAALPLAVLGYTWAVLYTQSKNLWTVIAVHAMWNSRVFLGSWFGL